MTFKSLTLMSAIALAAPALAQTTAPASTNAAQPAAAATPSASAQQPTAAATPSSSATPSAQAPAAATNPADAVAAVVSSGWSQYDADGNSQLSKAEFGKWMDALREQNPAQKAAVKDPAAWTAAAFAKADKDKSGGVSKTELEAFLKG